MLVSVHVTQSSPVGITKENETSFYYYIAGYFRGGKMWFFVVTPVDTKIKCYVRTYMRVNNPRKCNHECQETVKLRIFPPSKITHYTICNGRKRRGKRRKRIVENRRSSGRGIGSRGQRRGGKGIVVTNDPPTHLRHDRLGRQNQGNWWVNHKDQCLPHRIY